MFGKDWGLLSGVAVPPTLTGYNFKYLENGAEICLGGGHSKLAIMGNAWSE